MACFHYKYICFSRYVNKSCQQSNDEWITSLIMHAIHLTIGEHVRDGDTLHWILHCTKFYILFTLLSYICVRDSMLCNYWHNLKYFCREKENRQYATCTLQYKITNSLAYHMLYHQLICILVEETHSWLTIESRQW